jgi:hypothetical protein
MPAEGKGLCKGWRGNAHFLANEAKINTGGELLSIRMLAGMGSAERWWETMAFQVMCGIVKEGGEGEDNVGRAATKGDVLTMDPKDESGQRTAESLSYMMAVMVAMLRSVDLRVVTEKLVAVVETAAVCCPCSEQSVGAAQQPSPRWQT